MIRKAILLCALAARFPCTAQDQKTPERASPVICRNSEDCYNQGKERYKAHQFSEAIRFYESALTFSRTEPSNDDFIADLHNSIGRSYYSQQQYQLALPHLQQAVQRNPAGPGYQLNLGAALYSLGKPDDALPALTRCIEQYPPQNKDLARCYFLRAKTLFAKDPIAAEPDAKNAISKDPQPEYFGFLARLYAGQLCRLGDAEKTVHDGLERTLPGSPERKELETIGANLKLGPQCNEP